MNRAESFLSRVRRTSTFQPARHENHLFSFQRNWARFGNITKALLVCKKSKIYRLPIELWYLVRLHSALKAFSRNDLFFFQCCCSPNSLLSCRFTESQSQQLENLNSNGSAFGHCTQQLFCLLTQHSLFYPWFGRLPSTGFRYQSLVSCRELCGVSLNRSLSQSPSSGSPQNASLWWISYHWHVDGPHSWFTGRLLRRDCRWAVNGIRVNVFSRKSNQ